MNEFELQHLPEAYRPLSPWSYFGLGILYSLPLVGWIFLIVHAIGSANMFHPSLGSSTLAVAETALIATWYSSKGVFAKCLQAM